MSKKDSYWFRHDSTAGRALKMRKMSHIYGHWGKGVYWDVCEILRDNENYRFESDDSSLQMLADLIGCKDEDKFLNWYKDCVKYSLLKEEDNFFFSPALSESMQKWDSSKANGSKGGRPKKTQTKPKRNPTNNPTETITVQNKTKQDSKEIKWDLILTEFNKIVNRKHKTIPDKVKTAYKARLKEGYTHKEIFLAINNCRKDKFHIENKLKFLTLEFITRQDKLEHWLNINSNSYTPNKSIENMTTEERSQHLINIMKS